MATQEEIRASWTDANIRRVRQEEYERDLRDLALKDPKKAKSINRYTRRETWRMKHRRLPKFLAKILVH